MVAQESLELFVMVRIHAGQPFSQERKSSVISSLYKSWFNSAMRIKIFTTGGTIDKVYFDAKSEFEVGSPQVQEVLQESNVVFTYAIESILRKDSLDITDEDRRLIRRHVEAEPCERVVITHGTDTIVETAKVL